MLSKRLLCSFLFSVFCFFGLCLNSCSYIGTVLSLLSNFSFEFFILFIFLFLFMFCYFFICLMSVLKFLKFICIIFLFFFGFQVWIFLLYQSIKWFRFEILILSSFLFGIFYFFCFSLDTSRQFATFCFKIFDFCFSLFQFFVLGSLFLIELFFKIIFSIFLFLVRCLFFFKIFGTFQICWCPGMFSPLK